MRGSSVDVCYFLCFQSRTDGEKEPNRIFIGKRLVISITRASDVSVLHAEYMEEISAEPVTARLQQIMSDEGLWVGGHHNASSSASHIVDAILNSEVIGFNSFRYIQLANNVWRGIPSEFFMQTVPERKVSCATFMSDPKKHGLARTEASSPTACV